MVLTGIASTYPALAFNWNIGFALTARHFCQTATKVPKKALPHRTALAALRFPHSGPAPWARRHGPSMAHRGSPGIHAGRPTPQNLHSASRRAVDQEPPRRPTGRPDWRQYVYLSKICFSFAFAFAFAFVMRLFRQRECPSQKAERRCCYGGGAAGRRRAQARRPYGRARPFCLLLWLSVRVKVPVALVLLATTDYGLCTSALGIQIHRICQFPVACSVAPATGISFSCTFIKSCSGDQ